MLIRSDELYKFSDRTLTGLRTSLDDITKNILMEYLPKRKWSTLGKKRANIMIKVIDKQLKERSLIRSLEKFIDFFDGSLFLMMVAARRGRRQSVKVKELQEKGIIKASKLSYQEKYEHVGPNSQDHKMARLHDDVKRLCLVDDLKKFNITYYQVKA
ncbi:hypothetical protein Tco_0300287 [Tanacetum coccineum]